MLDSVDVFRTEYYESHDDGATWRKLCVKNYVFPNEIPDFEDVTSSCDGQYRAFKEGLIDPGQETLRMTYTSDEYATQFANRGNLTRYRARMPLQGDQTTEGDRFEYRAIPYPRVVTTDHSGGEHIIELSLKLSGETFFFEGS